MDSKRNIPKAKTILLESVLDLRAAASLAHDFSKIRGADVNIDASNVERLGAQCVQVLLSAEKTWAAEGLTMKIINSSSDFLEGLKVLGIGLLNCQLSEAGA